MYAMPQEVTRRLGFVLAAILAVTAIVSSACTVATTSPDQKTKPGENPYAEYVWPPPPDTARIQLVDILSSRKDVEASSSFGRVLIGASQQGPYDRLRRPIGVAIDAKGRVLVSDIELGAIIRFDRAGRRMDVFGTTGVLRLKTPIAVTVAPDQTVYVADAGLHRIVSYDAEGEVLKAFGKPGDLVNPTDAAVSPDGKLLYVCDSKAHQIVVFDLVSGDVVNRFGSRGEGEGEFNFPTSIAFDRDGSLFVVDQMNSRVEIVAPDGEFLDQIGGLGITSGSFVRPKDIAIDSRGYIYVTDAAFNNVQIFDNDLRLLTFVGSGGSGPGQFQIAGGVAIQGDTFAIVDQLGKRVEVFRYLDNADVNRESKER